MVTDKLALKVNKLNRRNLASRFMFVFLGLSLFYALYLCFWNPFFLQGQIVGIYWLIPFIPFFLLILFVILDLCLIVVVIGLTERLLRRSLITLLLLCCCVFLYSGDVFFFDSHMHQDSISIEGKVYRLDFNYLYFLGDIYKLEIFECDITGLFCKLSSKPQPIYQTNTPALERRYYLTSDPRNKSMSIMYEQKAIYTCYIDNKKPTC